MFLSYGQFYLPIYVTVLHFYPPTPYFLLITPSLPPSILHTLRYCHHSRHPYSLLSSLLLTPFTRHSTPYSPLPPFPNPYSLLLTPTLLPLPVAHSLPTFYSTFYSLFSTLYSLLQYCNHQ